MNILTKYITNKQIVKPLYVFFALLLSSFAQAKVEITEVQLKGALIHKIASYVTWQNNASLLTFCFYGEKSHEVGDFLQSQKINGRLPSHIEINNLNKLNDVSCNILYIDKSSELDTEQLNQISSSTFTLTNSKELIPLGFIASIELDRKKPILTLSKRNLKRTDLMVDSRFLSVVTLVK